MIRLGECFLGLYSELLLLLLLPLGLVFFGAFYNIEPTANKELGLDHNLVGGGILKSVGVKGINFWRLPALSSIVLIV